MENIKIGDIVYFYNYAIDAVEKAIVEKVFKTTKFSKYCLEEEAGAKVRSICVVDYEGNLVVETYGTSNRPIKSLYKSSHDVYDFVKKKKDEEIERYCVEIKTLEDLLKFPVIHSLEYEDGCPTIALDAYKIMAKKLANIDI